MSFLSSRGEGPRRGIRRRRTAGTVVAATAAVGLLVCSCSSAASGPETAGAEPTASAPGTSTGGADGSFSLTAPADVKKAGALSICADITFPPMTFMKDNQPTGFDVDVADRIASAMGVTAQFHQTGFPNIIGALQGGKCNMIINGMSYTPERAKQVSMVAYLQDAVGFITQVKNPAKINGIDDLSGKRVAVQVGGVGLIAMQDVNKELAAKGLPKATLVNFTQDPSAFEAVISKKVDAFAQDQYVMAYYESKFPGQVEQLDLSVHPQTAVISVRKDETELISALKEGVAHLYETGEMTQLVKKWGITENDLLPKDKWGAQLS